jgi:peptide-methionine (S)-S-oxide reductase
MNTTRTALPTLAIALSLACSGGDAGAQEDTHRGTQAAPPVPEGRAEAIFAGGCFWCMEGPFEAVEGVDSVVSGYTDGHVEHPAYRDVGSGRTGHTEAVRVVYDPRRVTYAELLTVFWHNIDPLQRDGQFCDRGTQYRTGIYVANAEERRLAEASREAAARELDRPVSAIATEIEDASTFWVAEAYHQDYYRTHPIRYRSYRAGCGRDRRLQELWGAAAEH